MFSNIKNMTIEPCKIETPDINEEESLKNILTQYLYEYTEEQLISLVKQLSKEVNEDISLAIEEANKENRNYE